MCMRKASACRQQTVLTVLAGDYAAISMRQDAILRQCVLESTSHQYGSVMDVWHLANRP